MPDQTIKHNNAAPGFLLVLIPAAFLAVVLATAWKFILGVTLLLTGNSVWQSYQWTKIAQQVDPAFSRLVIDRQGEVTPLELSTRANISGALAQRYLHNKAVEFGGVSYQSPNGNQVYSFLTVGTLGSTFVDIEPEVSLEQKLAELEPAQTLSGAAPKPSEQLVVVEPAILTAPPEVFVTAEQSAPAEPVTMVSSSAAPEPSEQLAVVEPTVITAPAEPVPTMPEILAKTELPTVEPVQTLPPQVIAPPPAVEPTLASNAEGSNFTQALRSIFNNPPASIPEESVVETETTALEIISQADLAKRLDVHSSTIYKRRSDVSFVDWTRNRDPEGVAWGYSRDTKEFYRIG